MKTTESPRRIRVLHIVGGMDRGGVETWLMHVLRHIDRERFQMDFMVHTAKPCAYDDEVRALGGRILPCVGHTRPWSYGRNLRHILAAYGPYDVMHSHVHHYSGYTLRLAHRAAIPVRIAHSHCSAGLQNVLPNLFRWTYLKMTKRWLRRFATIGLAVSENAAEALFGLAWQRDPLCQLLYCGIDLLPFYTEADASIRVALQLPPGAFVLGHVGNFVEEKNHLFLLKVARSVVDTNINARLLLIGDGPLRPAIERRVAELGLTEHVVFAGRRSDVPRVLVGAVDVFVMPSLREGLPLAGLEAQAAGLPCVLSDTITRELEVVPQIIRRLSLSTPTSVWADNVLASRQMLPAKNRAQALKMFEHSPFNIANSVKHLQGIYHGDSVPSVTPV
jgi:glycosyltransferase involved in cell wall biosynthesis